MKVTYENIISLALEMQTQNWQEFRSTKLPTDQAIKLAKLVTEVKQKAEQFEQMRQEIIETASDKQSAIVALLKSDVDISAEPIQLPENVPYGIIEVLLPFCGG